MTPVSDLVQDYLADTRAAGKSPATLRNYGITLRLFMDYLGDDQ